MRMPIERTKRIRPTEIWGRGVTAALRTFNPVGVGSSPAGPTRFDGGSNAERFGA
jgi:hypothetical protein